MMMFKGVRIWWDTFWMNSDFCWLEAFANSLVCTSSSLRRKVSSFICRISFM